MKIYGIRESLPYEIHDLVAFFIDKDVAEEYAAWMNRNKSSAYDDYEVEEWEVH